jgi:hypothetical protein
MTEAYEKLIEILDERELRYTLEPENLLVKLDFAGKTAFHRLRLWVDGDLLQAVGFVSARVPEGCRPAIVETLARASIGLRLGRFEVDFDSGEVRFRVASFIGDSGVTSAVTQRLIDLALQMLDMYLPPIMCVIYANETPNDAIRDARALWKVNS